MERATAPARDPHASTADLLSWPESPATDSAFTVSANTSRYNSRTHQPIDGISKTLYGGQINEEESESLNQRKPCSGYKQKDNTGNKIFAAAGEDSATDSATSDFYSSNRTAVRIVQHVTNGISQISFSAEEDASPKKPITLPAGAKQRELSGTLGDPYSTNKVHFSDAKCKELVGHDIFGPPPEVPPRAALTLESNVSKVVEEPEPPAPRNVHTSVRVSNPAGGQSNILFGEEPVVKTTKKIHDQKFAELTGNDIFKGDVPPVSAEKPPSMKQKEMSGSNIFADGKAASRDYQRGVRKPPGGESSITLN